MPRDFRLPGMFQNLKEAKVLGEEWQGEKW
jgi:hypothetical protein